jgi:hypothetical protein
MDNLAVVAEKLRNAAEIALGWGLLVATVTMWTIISDASWED